MSWGCYVNFNEFNVAIYIPRKVPSEVEEMLQDLSKQIEGLENLDLSGIHETEETLTLIQVADIVKCAECVSDLLSDCMHPHCLIAALLYRMSKDIEIEDSHTTGFVVIE